jgi:predicted phosphodiesterase
MPDPRSHDGEMNVMVMADWGPSYDTGMIPIHEKFREVHANRKIDLLIIIGDIAYNLDSRNGLNYVEFL